MKRLGLFSILFILLFACQKDYNKTKQPHQFIPKNTQAVIQINELNDFISSIKNNDVLSGIHNDDLKNASQILKHFNTTQKVFISLLDTIKGNSDYVILTPNDSTIFVVDSIPNHISKTLVDLDIQETQIEKSTIYHKVVGKTFAASNNLKVLQELNSKNEDTELSRLIESTNQKSVASVLFKSTANNYSKLLFSDVLGNDKSNFTVLDFNHIDKGLHYSGILTSKDSSTNHLEIFKNTLPQKTNTPSIAPYNTSSLISIAYDDFSVFNKNLKTFNNNDDEEVSTESFLNFTNEIALIDEALVLHTLDPKLILESIEEKSVTETFRSIDIFEFEQPEFFTTKLKPFISYDNAQYFSVYENFIVFASTLDQLKRVLTQALNSNTLSNSEAFKNINQKLSSESSLFIFKNAEALSDALGQPMNNYNANAVQFIREDNFTYVNGIIREFKKRAASNSVTEVFTTKIDATILMPPQTVINHISKSHDIVVQDVNNVLYLISSSGSILWKKQLHGKILGQVEQIDMYKNGRLQLAFATPHRLYVLDRNGNNVSPFPLKFNNEITQPLSVFDYENRRNYRLLITQGKNLLMYTAKGKFMNGFKYKSKGAEIISQPHHFRIGSKDYIVFGAGETLKILNRQGSIRINVKDKIHFSGNDIYLYQNKFTTTNTLGQLTQVDTRGRINTTSLNLTDKHRITTTSKTLVTLTENKLKIKSRTVDLDYGEYTEPRIFYLNDKIYVSTTDLQSKKVYLFDSQAEPIPNFPVFGTGPAELQKLDKDQSLELITQSDDKTIVVYKLH